MWKQSRMDFERNGTPMFPVALISSISRSSLLSKRPIANYVSRTFGVSDGYDSSSELLPTDTIRSSRKASE